MNTTYNTLHTAIARLVDSDRGNLHSLVDGATYLVVHPCSDYRDASAIIFDDQIDLTEGSIQLCFNRRGDAYGTLELCDLPLVRAEELLEAWIANIEEKQATYAAILASCTETAPGNVGGMCLFDASRIAWMFLSDEQAQAVKALKAQALATKWLA